MDSNRHGDWPLECKVYIGDLGEDATRHEIEDCFAKFGPVRNIWVAKRPPGFAFVLMDDARDAEDATKELDGSRMCGKRVKVREAVTCTVMNLGDFASINLKSLGPDRC